MNSLSINDQKDVSWTLIFSFVYLTNCHYDARKNILI